MMAPLLIVSSWWKNWWTSHWCCTNSQRAHRGLLAGGKNTQGRYMEGEVYYGELSLLLLLEGGEWGAQVRTDISPIGFMDSWTCNRLLRWS
jgi:hypothetical protein